MSSAMYEELLAEERAARRRERNLAKARRAQERARAAEAREAERARRRRIRELGDQERALGREYRVALRATRRVRVTAPWTPEEEEAWNEVARIGGQLRGVIATRRRLIREAAAANGGSA